MASIGLIDMKELYGYDNNIKAMDLPRSNGDFFSDQSSFYEQQKTFLILRSAALYEEVEALLEDFTFTLNFFVGYRDDFEWLSQNEAEDSFWQELLKELKTSDNYLISRSQESFTEVSKESKEVRETFQVFHSKGLEKGVILPRELQDVHESLFSDENDLILILQEWMSAQKIIHSYSELSVKELVARKSDFLLDMDLLSHRLETIVAILTTIRDSHALQAEREKVLFPFITVDEVIRNSKMAYNFFFGKTRQDFVSLQQPLTLNEVEKLLG